ncbi:MAG: hypothetical protein WCP18_00155 [bacterium]
MNKLDWKKIGIIAMIIISAILMGLMIYYFFWRTLFAPMINQPVVNNANINGLPPTGNINVNGRIFVNVNGQLIPAENIPTTPTTTPPITIVTSTAPGESQAITKETSFFTTTNSKGEVIYYNPDTGKFNILGTDGKLTAFSDKIFHNVQSVTWGNTKNRAVLTYPDGSTIMYDFTTDKQITLPSHWTDFSFSLRDDQIVFKSIALDKENRFLAIANYDGTQAKSIEDIGGVEDKFQSAWSPNNQVIATFSEGRDAGRSNVYFVGQNHENFKLMIVEGRDFRGQWSPDGSKVLYSVYDPSNNFQPTLWVADASTDSIGNNRQALGINTWGNKCTFGDADHVYCSVPQNLPYGAGLQPNIADGLPESIYQINLKTGAENMVANPNTTIGQMSVSPDGKTIFYTNTTDNRVYKVTLP